MATAEVPAVEDTSLAIEAASMVTVLLTVWPLVSANSGNALATARGKSMCDLVAKVRTAKSNKRKRLQHPKWRPLSPKIP
jgi:hypothetical protein